MPTISLPLHCFLQTTSCSHSSEHRRRVTRLALRANPPLNSPRPPSWPALWSGRLNQISWSIQLPTRPDAATTAASPSHACLGLQENQYSPFLCRRGGPPLLSPVLLLIPPLPFQATSLQTTLWLPPYKSSMHAFIPITSCNTCRNPGHTAPYAPQCRSSLRRPGLLSCPFLSQPLTSKAARCIFSTTCKYAITLTKSNNCNFSWSFLQQLQKLEMGAMTNHHLSWKISDFAVCSFHFEPRYSLQSRRDISKTAITELYMTSVITVSCTVRRC